jgi:hypothetical protein
MKRLAALLAAVAVLAAPAALAHGEAGAYVSEPARSSPVPGVGVAVLDLGADRTRRCQLPA